jgi:large repetitive protein
LVSVANINSGLLVFTPAANSSGSNYANFTFQVQDDGGTANGGVNLDPVANTLTFNVTGVNDAPSIAISSVSYNVNEQLILALEGTGISVADADNDPLTITINGGNSYSQLTAVAGTSGVVIASGNGTDNLVLTGTAAQLNNFFAGNNGATLGFRIAADTPPASTQLSITIDDGTATASDTAIINIAALNDAPVNTLPAAQTTAEDTPKIISGISVSDVDAAAGNITVTLGVVHGTLTINGGGATLVGNGTANITITGTLAAVNASLAATLTYSPAANYQGADQLTMTTLDNGNTGAGGNLSATNVLAINVTSVNDLPQTSAVTLAGINEDTLGRVITQAELLANASDIDGDSLTAVGLVISAGKGLLVDNGNGTWTYTPAANDDTSVSFSYSISDGSATVAATAMLDIIAVNDVPVASPVTLAPIGEDSGARLITQSQLLANATDVDGDSLTALGLAISAGKGSLVDNGDGTWTYTPAANDDTSASFSYSISDGSATIAAVANLDIVAVNDAPTSSGLAPINNSEDADGDTRNLFAAFADLESADEQLTFSVVSNSNPNLVVSLTIDPATGILQLRYGANQFGSSDLIVRATDPQGASVDTLLRVNIAAVNDAPTTSGVGDVQLNNTITSKILDLGNSFIDIEDGRQLSFSIVSSSNASLLQTVQIDQLTGQITLTAAAKNSGETILVVRATDSEGAWVETSFKVALSLVTVPSVPETSLPPLDPAVPIVPSTPESGATPPDKAAPSRSIDAAPPVIFVDKSLPELADFSSGSELTTVDPDAMEPPVRVDNNRARIERIEQEQARSVESLEGLNTNALLSNLISPDSGFSESEAKDFNNQVRKLREEMDEVMAQQGEQKAVIAGVTFSITTGLLIWSLRASSLLLTLFSMIPLWRGMDPLPILDQVDKRKKELEQQRRDREKEDKSAKEVGYLFDHVDDQNVRKNTR